MWATDEPGSYRFETLDGTGRVVLDNGCFDLE
jgi:hypothetical protein